MRTQLEGEPRYPGRSLGGRCLRVAAFAARWLLPLVISVGAWVRASAAQRSADAALELLTEDSERKERVLVTLERFLRRVEEHLHEEELKKEKPK